jgi:deazaflavin-dependent oxidoreductase (nitroreductase family)
MPLPRVVARFNKQVTNRFLEPIARRSSGFAVVHHVGRRSGRAYTTPVNLFRVENVGDRDGDGVGEGVTAAVVVSLTYGPSADWVRNVLAGGGTVETRTGTRLVEAATVVGRDVAWPALPSVVRAALRVLRVRDFLQLTLAPPQIAVRPAG